MLPRQVPLEYLILDFERVEGADSSTILSLVRLLEQAEQQNVTVLCAAWPEDIAASLRSAGLDRAGQPKLHTFHDFDHALNVPRMPCSRPRRVS